MTAKEKAKELVNKFKEFADEDYMDNKQQFELNETRNLNAKQCALIAVDEIINENNLLDNYNVEFTKHLVQRFEFWQEVKQEINNL